MFGPSGGGEPVLNISATATRILCAGLIAILLTLYSGRTPREILGMDAVAIFDEFGFREHLTPQRSIRQPRDGRAEDSFRSLARRWQRRLKPRFICRRLRTLLPSPLLLGELGACPPASSAPPMG